MGMEATESRTGISGVYWLEEPVSLNMYQYVLGQMGRTWTPSYWNVTFSTSIGHIAGLSYVNVVYD